MKLDAFQGKRKAKDRWSEVEYVVTRQVTNDMPTYEVRDDGRNVNVTHSNRLFLESDVEGTLTRHLTSHVPLGWVDGVLWPLPSVALRPTVCRLSSGEGGGGCLQQRNG